MPRMLLLSARTARIVIAAVICAAAALTLAVPAHSELTGASAVQRRDETVTPDDAPTVFRVASLNVLGYGHTAPGGNKKGWASGITRMAWSWKAINSENASIVGLQELETPAFNKFKSLNSAGTYSWFPGLSKGRSALANTIIWRSDTWKRIDSGLLVVPYFHGQAKPMPYVKLLNRVSGDMIWVYNSHNPANVRGPATKWRNIGFQREAALVNRLRAAEPDVPVIVTGDKNDKSNYFCQVAPATGMVAPNMAGMVGSSCQTKDIRIDWVLGTPDVTFANYIVRRDALIRRATDHPMVLTDAMLPAKTLVAAGIKHVAIIDLEGLTRRRALRAPADSQLRTLIQTGASTMDARTDPASVDRLANVASILSGRPATRADGGTGLTVNGKATVHKSAGEYVSTIFDKTHNYGYSTGLFASFSEAARIVTSYDAVNGGDDIFGVDNGNDKLDHAVVSQTDGQTVRAFKDALASGPIDLSYIHLGLLSRTGLTYGFNSPEYKRAMATTDARLKALMRAVKKNSTMAGDTLFIVTADRGNTRSALGASDPAAYRVPLIVWGPGISPATSLYKLNLGFAFPGRSQDANAAIGPIRTGAIANLVNKLFALPALPGSTIDTRQTLTVLAPSDQ